MVKAFVFILVFSAVEVWACLCAPPPTVLDAREKADVVVRAKLLRVERPAGLPGERLPGSSKAVFTVVRNYKGGLSNAEEFDVAQDAIFGCRINFGPGDKDKEYLFFMANPAAAAEGSRLYDIGLCGRSRSLDKAAADVRFLDRFAELKDKTRISGNLEIAGKPQRSAAVSVTTALGEIFETTTDANGDFEFVGLPPGRYTLSSAPKSGGDPLRTAPPSGAEAVSDRVVYFTESSILVELKKGGQVEVRFLLDPGH